MYYIAIYSDSIYLIISVFLLSLPIYRDRTELIAKQAGWGAAVEIYLINLGRKIF